MATELHGRREAELQRIPPEVSEQLEWYVYLYIDPRSSKPFYVGKGHGGRALAHLTETSDSDKVCVLKELEAAGMEPRIDILAYKLRNEEMALRIEAAVIDALELGRLTNQVRGAGAVQQGRVSLDELISQFCAKPVEVVDPVLLIRINKLFRYGMGPEELYDVTRGVWKVGTRRSGAKYAFAVFRGVVREVYEIKSWHEAGTTPYKWQREVNLPGRWEFLGCKAPEPLRSYYQLRSVATYFRPGQRSPVVYVNVPSQGAN